MEPTDTRESVVATRLVTRPVETRRRRDEEWRDEERGWPGTDSRAPPWWPLLLVVLCPFPLLILGFLPCSDGESDSRLDPHVCLVGRRSCHRLLPFWSPAVTSNRGLGDLPPTCTELPPGSHR